MPCAPAGLDRERGSTSRRTSRRCRALTLLELLLALGLMTLVSLLLFSFYDQVLRTREVAKQKVSAGFLARTVAHQIADEIRSANGFMPGKPGVTGKKRIISIQTVVLPDKKVFKQLGLDDKPPPAECDIRQVDYYLAYDADDENHEYADGVTGRAPLGLVRREVRTLNQTTLMETDEKSVHLDLVSKELKYVRFRYYDGVDWVDRWDIGLQPEGQLGNSLPQAVEITVGYKEVPPPEIEDEADKANDEDVEETELLPSQPEPYSPDTYTIMVRLPQADTFMGSRMMRAQKITRTQNSSSSSSNGGGR